MLKVKIEDIMSEDLITIDEDATVGQVAHILLRFRINGILVVKKESKNKLLGIITTTDLLRLIDKALLKKRQRAAALAQISRLPVKLIASKKIIKVQKSIKLQKVIGIMHKRNMHTIPIYSGTKLVGVVGRHDILNAAFA